ncbi:glycine betaine ABC transporter substrate-binding protein [Georgenia sp. TF02-10]|uniref:glycine betaine ABC transporter substrate-binding protein n=1 Tax=Georgenia sp. TF02-10 TaxID=2917725 RepID=UPI001FA78589|nr:glycine betaine ABC transporter substrate-binding protein [Georgenia sp. TF02-10]UNX55017.1 glycine betaine ABC transporter substrate-binding protein [Georgenia sp. TF02-10]
MTDTRRTPDARTPGALQAPDARTPDATRRPVARRPGRRRRALAAVAAAAAALALAGCGLQPANGYVPAVQPAGIAPIEGAEDVTVTVGSKNFTEQLVLGKIAVLALRAAGFQVVDSTNIPGAVAAREGMLAGDTDMQWEYTGTAWVVYLGQTGIPDQQQQWEAVRDADRAEGLTWLPPGPMNNTYGFAMGPDAAAELGITSMSQIADLPVEERTFCVESEFTARQDGLEPMLEHYGVPLGAPDGVPNDQIRVLDTGAVYAAVADGACNFGEVFTTDGRILALDLTVLEDDAKYFPSYNVAPYLDTELVEDFPRITEVFEEITPLLTDELLIELNARVDVEGEEPVDVAMDWLVSEGLVARPGDGG